MKRIATPMVGGVITATLMALLIYPAAFYLWRSRGLAAYSKDTANSTEK